MNLQILDECGLKFTAIVFILSCVAFLSLQIPDAESIGPYPCFYKIDMLEKSEYLPGETVTITAQHCDPETNDQATLHILDAKYSIYDQEMFNEIISGKHSVYKDTKNPKNGLVEFNYTIPQTNSFHQYMFLLEPEGNGGFGNGYFFTKEGASKISLSDLEVLNSPKLGENLRFKVKATDGVGTPISVLRLYADVDYRDCLGNEIELQNSISASDFEKEVRNQYMSSGIVWGWLPIKQGMPGTYTLSVYGQSEASSNNEWTQSDIVTTEFDVLGDPAKENRIEIFIDSYYPNHENYVEFADVGMRDDFHATVQIKSESCLSQDLSIPLNIELYQTRHYQDWRTDESSPTSLYYGKETSCFKIPEMCSSERIGKIEIPTTANQFVSIPRNFFEPITKEPGEYLLRATATIDGKLIEKKSGIRTHNIATHNIVTEEEKSYVWLDSWYSGPGRVSFDKEEKTLAVDVNTTDNIKRISILVPHELLSGEYTLFVDGKEKILDKSNFKKYEGTTLFSIHGTEDDTNIKIIGTIAIPEFGIITTLIFGLSVIPIVFFRKQLKIK